MNSLKKNIIFSCLGQIFFVPLRTVSITAHSTQLGKFFLFFLSLFSFSQISVSEHTTFFVHPETTLSLKKDTPKTTIFVTNGTVLHNNNLIENAIFEKTYTTPKKLSFSNQLTLTKKTDKKNTTLSKKITSNSFNKRTHVYFVKNTALPNKLGGTSKQNIGCVVPFLEHQVRKKSENYNTFINSYTNYNAFKLKQINNCFICSTKKSCFFNKLILRPPPVL